jgi:hypothetical protein
MPARRNLSLNMTISSILIEPPGDRPMNYRHTLIALTAGLSILQASAKTPESPDNNQPTMTLDTGSPLLQVEDSFLVARSRILRSGWQPVRMHGKDDYDFFGTEKELTDRDFMEFASCSMDAGALCTFYYRKEAKCLRVNTIGEQLKDMKVTRWTDECPVQTDAR